MGLRRCIFEFKVERPNHSLFSNNKISKSIDVGKMIGSIDGMKSFMNGDKFKLPNMFGGGRRQGTRGNMDAAPFPLALALLLFTR